MPLPQLLIIGNTPEFGPLITEMLTAPTAPTAPARPAKSTKSPPPAKPARPTPPPAPAAPFLIHHTTYESFRVYLTAHLIRETRLFLLDLWRDAPTGLRVEGLTVAEELLRLNALPLIISPLHFAGEIRLPFYWDLAAPDSLLERCQSLLKTPPPAPAYRAEFQALHHRFRHWNPGPGVHEESAGR